MYLNIVTKQCILMINTIISCAGPYIHLAYLYTSFTIQLKHFNTSIHCEVFYQSRNRIEAFRTAKEAYHFFLKIVSADLIVQYQHFCRSENLFLRFLYVIPVWLFDSSAFVFFCSTCRYKRAAKTVLLRAMLIWRNIKMFWSNSFSKLTSSCRMVSLNIKLV